LTFGKTFDDRDQAKIWIIKNQFSRRNLSDPEEAAAIAEYDELKRRIEGEKKPSDSLKKGSRMPQCGEREDGWTQDKKEKILSVATV
jgi:hypothetical protein